MISIDFCLSDVFLGVETFGFFLFCLLLSDRGVQLHSALYYPPFLFSFSPFYSLNSILKWRVIFEELLVRSAQTATSPAFILDYMPALRAICDREALEERAAQGAGRRSSRK